MSHRGDDPCDGFLCSHCNTNIACQRHFVLPGIDSYHWAPDLLPKYAHRGNRRSSAKFDDDWTSQTGYPRLKTRIFFVDTALDPSSIVEHENVRPGKAAATWARWERRHHVAGDRIYDRVDVIGRPDRVAAGRQALHQVDTPMAFSHSAAIEAGLLKLAIHVAGKNSGAMGHGRRQLDQCVESGVRLNGSI